MLINMKSWFVYIFIFVNAWCYGSETKVVQKVAMVNDTLYVVSHGERFVVDKKHILLKPKSSTIQTCESIRKISTTKSGKILAEVPEGRDVTEYVKELLESDNYESIEYKSNCNVYFSPNDGIIKYQKI